MWSALRINDDDEYYNLLLQYRYYFQLSSGSIQAQNTGADTGFLPGEGA